MLTQPIVNLCGNSKQSLVEQAMEIHHAIERVKTLIAESDIAHSRNFQGSKDLLTCYFQAREERSLNFRALRDMSDDYLNLALAINGQGGF